MVSPGSLVTVTVSNGPGYRTDWVGLFPAGAGDHGYIDWWYLNGQHTAPVAGVSTASFSFPAPAAEGFYEVRYYLNNSYTIAASSSAVSVAALPTMSISGISLSEGNTGPRDAVLEVTLSRSSLSPVSASWTTGNVEAVAGSDYLPGSGTIQFAPGETAKTVRVEISGDDQFEIDERFTVTLSGPVGATLAGLVATVTIQNDDSIGSTALTATPAMVSPGSLVTVTVSNGPGYRTDWVGLFPAGAGDRGYIDWWYLNGQHTAPTTGLSAASFAFVVPIPEGDYELRYYLNNGFTIAASVAQVRVATPPRTAQSNHP
jgi:hypothetical protein